MSNKKVHFDWDKDKELENLFKHQVTFAEAQRAFLDPKRVVVEDVAHSTAEDRFFCIGRVHDGILSVRFTYRGDVIRIYGAGFWRKGKKIYEEQNKIHKRT